MNKKFICVLSFMCLLSQESAFASGNGLGTINIEVTDEDDRSANTSPPPTSAPQRR